MHAKQEMNNANRERANELAIRSMSNTVNLHLNDPTDKYTPRPHWGTDPTDALLYVMPHTSKLRHMLAEKFLKYIKHASHDEMDPNGNPIHMTPQRAARQEYLTFTFKGTDIEAYRDMIQFLLDEGFETEELPGAHSAGLIDACIHCGDDAQQRVRGKPHILLCTRAECVNVIASMLPQ